jgi:hypothetical protein
MLSIVLYWHQRVRQNFYLDLECSLNYFFKGKQRSRLLAILFKDERCQKLSSYNILEKMYLERIIRTYQVKQFESILLPHQKATTADGRFVFVAGDWHRFLIF